MKRFFICLCSLFMIFACACTPKINSSKTKDVLNFKVAAYMEKIENINSFDDNVLLALSVIIRTNIINGNIDTNNMVASNSRIINLSKKTSGEVLNLTEKQKLNIDCTPENYTWKREIKNYELLSFLDKHNISLANIKNIEPIFDQDKNFIELSVGGKKIDYYLLKSTFNLESSKITKIEKGVSSIIIFGEGKDLGRFDFDLNTAQKLSKTGKDYKQLLNYFFKEYDLKTI